MRTGGFSGRRVGVAALGAVIAAGVCVLVCRWAGSDEVGIATADERGGQVEALRAQIVRLVETVAAVRAEADALKLRVESYEFGNAGVVTLRPAGPGSEAGAGLKIEDVNSDLGMVILNAGARQGIRAGARFAVLRADQNIAEVRVVDVRDGLAGAVILRTVGGESPVAGDGVTAVGFGQ